MLYLATNFNPIFWNTACLVVDSSATSEDDDKSSDYGKIAKALGDCRRKGINVSLVNINESGFSFKPDIENNRILFGLKGLSRIGTEMVNQIISGRPYISIKDFMRRIKANKTTMITLIKGGAFDELHSDMSRKEIMAWYLWEVCEKKTKLNLQNIGGLITYGMIPEHLDFERRVFNFNKYIKKKCKIGDGSKYLLDTTASDFYNKNFDVDALEIGFMGATLDAKDWDGIYQTYMDNFRNWLKVDQEDVLGRLNSIIFKEAWLKYAQGSLSAWEMDSMCYYYHEHELQKVLKSRYGIVDFNTLNPESEIEYYITRNNREFPIYKIDKIIGTVIDRNKSKSSVTLLTVEGVVTVKFTRDYYSMFDKQISERQPDGTKKIVEKSWFTRGSKILVAGFRRQDTFVAKTYTKTGCHQLYKISDVDEYGQINITSDRASGEEEYAED